MDKKTLSPEELVQEIRKLREEVPLDGRPLDAEKILAKLAEIRSMMPLEGIPLSRPKEPRQLQGLDLRTKQDFDDAAVIHAVESLAADAQAIVDAGMERAFEMALDVYYKAEELARDPENAELVQHVENMRRAFENSYGHPIPTKAETDARRAREARAREKEKEKQKAKPKGN